MKKLRAGIVGVGKIGRAQIDAIRKLDFAEVAAIVVRDADRAARLAEELGVPAFYTDYRGLIADPSIDVVHDCTPNLEHFRINRDAILAGKAVLSEKPLTVDSRESAELVELAKAHKVPTAVNFVYRHYPMLQRLKTMIEGGELGTIYSIRGSYLQDWLLRETDWDWRIEARLGGPSRAMADIGSHWCDLAQFLLGQDITEVCADLATFIPFRLAPPEDRAAIDAKAHASLRVEVDTEDYCASLLRFAGGVRGSFTVSQVSAGRKFGLSLEIDGSEASVHWDQEAADRINIGCRDRPIKDLTIDAGLQRGAAGLRDQAQKDTIDAFYRTILFGDEPRYADFADGHRSVLVVAAALASDRSRNWVQIP
ncbi:MAG: Gfo/Idh/MocA family oxidoreductase [Spirochaetes bacterium]|nr:Gfo/Idh/MocA family oxidoreductase [Spirochaetota bacterium]